MYIGSVAISLYFYVVSTLIAPLLENELSELKIPDISDESKIKHIGKIKYTISK